MNDRIHRQTQLGRIIDVARILDWVRVGALTRSPGRPAARYREWTMRKVGKGLGLINNPGLFTLLDGVGKIDLGLAWSRFGAAIDAFIAAICFMDAETDDQSSDVLVIAPTDQDTAGLARLGAEKLRTVLSGMATFGAADFPLLGDQRLSLAALFAGGFVNLRPFFPGLDDAGNPDLCQFPDPTFGDLAPDVTHEELSRSVCSAGGGGILGLTPSMHQGFPVLHHVHQVV